MSSVLHTDFGCGNPIAIGLRFCGQRVVQRRFPGQFAGRIGLGQHAQRPRKHNQIMKPQNGGIDLIVIISGRTTVDCIMGALNAKPDSTLRSLAARPCCAAIGSSPIW